MHLKRHKVAADPASRPVGNPIAVSLLACCKERGPSMLVVGAYEHSKFREDFIRGVTAGVMRDIRISALFSR